LKVSEPISTDQKLRLEHCTTTQTEKMAQTTKRPGETTRSWLQRLIEEGASDTIIRAATAILEDERSGEYSHHTIPQQTFLTNIPIT
jgi:hypothetical protein